MKWIQEPDEDDETQVNHALVLEPDEPLLPAFVEYWKRILTDGCAKARKSHWESLAIDIAECQVEGDEQGCMQAVFHNGQQNPCSGIARYFVRSDMFTLIQPRGEDNKTFNRRQIRWLLEQFTNLKQAARDADVRKLLDKINAIRPLPIEASTSYGWFDLQVDKDSFGRLPSEDREMLAGRDPGPPNPLKDLMGGIIDFD